MQFIGDKLDKITLKFNFHSQYCQPTTELNRLREAMTAHRAMALVFGNGDYRGWFVITDLTATHQHTDPYGNVIAGRHSVATGVHRRSEESVTASGHHHSGTEH